MARMKIDIVMPSLNQLPFLKQALDSILSQEGLFEVKAIVVDGGSTDGSVELLKSIDDPRLAWSSEADGGQADAVNKGLAETSGEVVGWLNSDDLYRPGALTAVVAAFGSHPEAQWLIGRCRIVDAEDREIRRGVTRYKNWGLDNYSYRRLLRENFVSQMGVFWRRPFGEGTGSLDTSLSYAMDYDLWLRMARRSEPLILDQVLADFRFHPGTKSGKVDRRQFDEEFEVARREAEGYALDLWIHRFHREKIVWSYRLMKLLGL